MKIKITYSVTNEMEVLDDETDVHIKYLIEQRWRSIDKDKCLVNYEWEEIPKKGK